MQSTVLFVPGLRGHVADHWQTLLAAQIPGARTVEPLLDGKLSCKARVMALDVAIAAINGPVILAAHSAGCLTIAHWAEYFRRPVRGALLATPADIESPLPEGDPSMDQLQSNGWLPIPQRFLPFPSILAASTNDPLASLERTERLAKAWGSRFAILGPVGRLNRASGFGAWNGAMAFLETLDRLPASTALDAPQMVI